MGIGFSKNDWQKIKFRLDLHLPPYWHVINSIIPGVYEKGKKNEKYEMKVNLTLTRKKDVFHVNLIFQRIPKICFWVVVIKVASKFS